MLKELAFQKGWAGITISRAETAERLNPIMREQVIVNRSYDAVIKSVDDKEASLALAALQKTSRMNAGKIAETIHSCGIAAFNGTELNPDDFHLGTGSAALEQLQELDASFLELLNAELSIEHQMRTRAILGVLRASTEERLAELRSQLKRIR